MGDLHGRLVLMSDFLEPLDDTLAVIAEEWRPLIEEKEEKELSKSRSEMEEDESL